MDVGDDGHWGGGHGEQGRGQPREPMLLGGNTSSQGAMGEHLSWGPVAGRKVGVTRRQSLSPFEASLGGPNSKWISPEL